MSATTSNPFAEKLAALGSLMESDAIRRVFAVLAAIEDRPALVDALRHPTSLKGCTLPMPTGPDASLSVSEMDYFASLWDAGLRSEHLHGADVRRMLWPEREA